jgi:ATP-dependent DNA helicase RecG
MIRLLQGDVGSGKTLVALAAALQAIQSGYQAAFLAPTDVLAQQHFRTAQQLLKNQKLSIFLYTARHTGKTREKILRHVKEGTIQLLIGTHTLIQEGVEFKHLGLANR